MFVLVKVRSLDVEKTGENVDEDLTDPGSHLVGLRTSEMNVEHKNCYADAEGVEDHGEEDKLAEEGHHQGGGRDDLCQQEEEHGEGEEDVDGETHLQSLYFNSEPGKENDFSVFLYFMTQAELLDYRRSHNC